MSDTGPGIKAQHLPVLFSAGFTTRPGSRGLGLGVRRARAFAERHGGAISVESTGGAGTTFHVWLPRANFTEAEPAALVAATRPRHVLLAGQPADFLRVTAEALRLHGLDTVVAGDDAEEFLADPDVAFDALLLCAAKDDPEPARLIHFVRRHRLPLKMILQPAGCTEEDLDPQLLAKADLILAANLSLDQLAEKVLESLT